MIAEISRCSKTVLSLFNKLIFFVITIVISSSNISVFAQENNPKIEWNPELADLKVSSPRASNIPAGDDFYLRYTQNINSFEKTTSIKWVISNLSGQNIYQRETSGNQDKNEKVVISSPGKYTIKLSLKVDDFELPAEKTLLITPKDKTYFKDLYLNEIDFDNKQFELYNKGEEEIDLSTLDIIYNQDQKFSLSKNKFIPAKSFAVININSENKIQKDKPVLLTYTTNSSNLYTEIISRYDPDLLDLNYINITNKTAQLVNSNWVWEAETLGRLNQNTKNRIEPVKTVRTGGESFEIIAIIPFLIVLLIVLFDNIALKKEDQS